MASITDRPPAEIAHELSALSSELDRVIPAKLLDRNLLVATWNISNLDEVTEKWISALEDKPRRDLHAMRVICDILARFDVIAVQKIRHAGKALQIIMQGLGSHWGLLVTTNARGALGFSERLAFIFDTRKVTPQGLAGQLVLSEEDLRRPGKKYLSRQFARPPLLLDSNASTSASLWLISMFSLEAPTLQSVFRRSRRSPVGWPIGR